MRSHGYHFWVIKSYISPSEAASEKNAVFSRTEKKITSSFFFLSFKPKKGKAESVLQILTQALMVKFSLIWFFTFFLHMKGALNNLRFLWFSLLFLWKKFYISFRESLHRLPCFSDCLRRQLCKSLKLIYQPIPSPAFALPWSRMKYCADSVCEWLNF